LQPDLTGLQKNIEQARTDKNKWDIILPKKEERIKRTMQDIAREKVQLERQSAYCELYYSLILYFFQASR